MKDVAQAVRGDLPTLREGGNERTFRPRLHQPVEELHAKLDVRPGDRGLRIGVVRQEARRNSQLGGRIRMRGRRRPQCKRTLVRVVCLLEAKRRVQRERELEENERRVLRLPALLEQREQGAVVLDGLVDRVLLARLVSRT